MTARPKIFIIGFNRCGTVSLHEFFKRAGLRSIHCDEGRLAVTMTRNALAGERVIAGYENYDVFSDMYYACVHGIFEANEHFREIAKQEPEARFILNVRNVDSWVKSRSYWHDMGLGPYPADCDMECNPPACRLELVEAHRRHFGYSSVEEVFRHWRNQWQAHLMATREYLPPERLLVFDIERDDPVSLCRFAGFSDSYARYWKRRNRSLRMPTTARLARRIPWRLAKFIPRPIRNGARFLSSRIEHATTGRAGR